MDLLLLGIGDLVELVTKLEQLVDLSLNLVDDFLADLARLLHLMLGVLGEVEERGELLLHLGVVLELLPLLRLRQVHHRLLQVRSCLRACCLLFCPASRPTLVCRRGI